MAVFGDHPEPLLTLKWQHKEYWWGERATFKAAGFTAIVQDCDGDSSWWEIRRGKDVLAKGESIDHMPYYHYDACLLAAEAALRAAVAKRKAELANAPACPCNASGVA